MHILWPVAFAAAVIAVVAPRGAAAQIDYRNLDDDRPTRIEDAYPVERYAFEVIVPFSYSRASNGTLHHASTLELTYGALRDAQLGVKAPLAVSDDPGSGNRTSGLSGVRVFALYNFNSDAPLLPALSLRGDVHVPAGALGGDQVRGELKAIATRSLGRTRIHLNGAVGIGAEGTAPAVEGIPRWWAGAALDRTLYRHSVLLIAELYALRDTQAAPVELNAGLGARWQVTPTLVLDAGVARRLRSSGPDLEVTVGFSHAFAIAGLMPARPAAPADARGHDAHH